MFRNCVSLLSVLHLEEEIELKLQTQFKFKPKAAEFIKVRLIYIFLKFIANISTRSLITQPRMMLFKDSSTIWIFKNQGKHSVFMKSNLSKENINVQDEFIVCVRSSFHSQFCRFKIMQDYYYEEHYRELYDNEKPLQLVLFWAQNGLMKRLYFLWILKP